MGEQRDRGNRSGPDGLAPDRRSRLEPLPGWSWAPHADTWERHYTALLAFVREHGHAAVPTGLVVGDLQLGSWVVRHRHEYKRDLMTAERAVRLSAVPGWMWDTRDASWAVHLQALRAFIAREGHALVPSDHVEDGPAGPVKLGPWVVATRSRAKSGALACGRIADLDAVGGWAWDANAAKWEAGWQALVCFVERTGHTRVPSGHVEGGVRLGQWVRVQCSWAKSGRLTSTRATRLGALPGWHERQAQPDLFSV